MVWSQDIIGVSFEEYTIYLWSENQSENMHTESKCLIGLFHYAKFSALPFNLINSKEGLTVTKDTYLIFYFLLLIHGRESVLG